MPRMMENNATIPKSLLDIMQDPEGQARYSEMLNEESSKGVPFLASDVSWVGEKNEWVQPDAKRKLEEAIVRAQAAGIGKKINVENCPWAVITETRQSLMQTMKLGKDSYLEKGTKSRPRQCLRQGYIFGQVIAPLATLIPDEKGLNVLRAGLSMIFAALERREANRDKIFQTFEDVGDILEDAERVAKPDDSPFDKGLRSEAVELYATIVGEIPELLDLLNHKTPKGNVFKKALSYFPQAETKRIEEIIDNIKRPYNRLEHHVTALCREKLMELGDLGRQLLKMTAEINEKMDTLASETSEMGQRLQEFKTCNTLGTPSAEMEALSQLKGLHRQSWQPIWALVPVWVNTTVNGIFQNGCDMQRTRVYMSYPPSPLLPPRPASARSNIISARPHLTISRIIKAIDAPNPLTVTQDIISVLSEGTTMEDDALSRAHWLLTCTRFRTWLMGPHSDFLFVDGDCASAITPRTSALSVICASMLATIRKHAQTCVRPSIALGFFCGQHFSPSGDESDHDLDTNTTGTGPLGALGSLITQLITYPGTPAWRLDANTNSQYQSALQAIDDIQRRINPRQTARAMIHILTTLIRTFPTDTNVYIIIDNISEQEETVHSDWDEELEEIISGFLKLTTPAPGTINNGSSMNGLRERVHVKVLFTSASRCIVMERLLGLNQVNSVGEYYHIGLWAGNVDSIAGAASGFGGDFEAMFGGPGDDDDD